MNINICAYDTQSLLTTCDPQFNKNLHNTMFAGSIYTLATLTGWGWVYLQLEQAGEKGDIVLADANIRYLAPIAGVAYGKVSANEVIGETNQLQQKARAKFNIKVEILTGDKVAAEFKGKYVVIGRKN